MTKTQFLVAGLDGVPYRTLAAGVAEGWLPNVAALKRRGFFAELRPDVLPMTLPSVASFITGQKPGAHGVTAFEKQGRNYSLRLAHSADIGPAYWDCLGDLGPSMVVGLPLTYPARPINGVMLSHLYFSASAKRASYPAEAAGILSNSGLAEVIEKGRAGPSAYARAMAGIEAVAESAVAATDLHTLTVYFHETDLLLHRSEMATGFGGPDFITEMMRPMLEEVDAWLGRMLDAGHCENVVLFSDHGWDRYETVIGIVDVLRAAGLMATAANRDEIIQSHGGESAPVTPNGYVRFGESRAFALLTDVAVTHCGIRFNRKAKYDAGLLTEPESEAVAQEVREALLALKGPEGQNLVEAIYRADEIFNGPGAESGPELYAKAAEGCCFVLSAGAPQRRLAYANHGPAGFLLMGGSPFVEGSDASEIYSVCDVPATLLAASGLSVPDSFDGVAIEAAMADGFERGRLAAAKPSKGVDESTGLTPEEEREIVRRLVDLGYADE